MKTIRAFARLEPDSKPNGTIIKPPTNSPVSARKKSRFPLLTFVGLVLCVLATFVFQAHPYKPQSVQQIRAHVPDRPMYQVASGDFTGDGHPELAGGQHTGVVGLVLEGRQSAPLFQANLPRKYVWDESMPRLGAVGDINADGCDELFLVASTESNTSWDLLGYDAQAGAYAWTVPLPMGQDHNADGKWDGDFHVVGFAGPSRQCPRPLVFVMSVVRFDRYGRGLLAMDPLTGKEKWRFEMGPNPVPHCFWTGDLDNDGEYEIVLAGHAPGNLKGETVNGTSDDHAWLFVLDMAGQLKWLQVLGDVFCSPKFGVKDLDRDSRFEIVTWTAKARPNQLSVWDATTGQLMARLSRDADFWGSGLIPGLKDEPGIIITGSSLKGLQRYVYEASTLTLEGQCYDGPASVMCIGNVVPDEGPEVLASVGSNKVALLDRDLKILAEHGSAVISSHNPRGMVWASGPDMGFPVFPIRAGREALSLDPALSFWWDKTPARIAVFVLLLLLMWVEWRWRGQGTGPESFVTDQLLQLMRELDESSHGTICATRGLSRLNWLLTNYCRQSSDKAAARERLLNSLEDYKETVHKRLEDILALSAANSFEIKVVAQTRSALVAAEQIIVLVEAADFAPSEVSRGLPVFQEHVATVEQGFQHLRQAIHARFTIEVDRITERSLSLRRDRFNRLGIAVKFNKPINGEPVIGLIDGADYRFILENLLDNAERALGQTPEPELTVTIEQTEKSFRVVVADNGAGISEEDQDRLFSPHFSSRRGGGLGLTRSREKLDKWSGRISLVHSEVSHGSVFAVTMPVSRVAVSHPADPSSSEKEA